jgi:5-methylcytosine-specific restriction endonuclease McrA
MLRHTAPLRINGKSQSKHRKKRRANGFMIGLPGRKLGLCSFSMSRCADCRRSGRLNEATVVDHIIERSKGGDDYAQENLQSLCKPCHDAKTRRQGVFKVEPIIGPERFPPIVYASE